MPYYFDRHCTHMEISSWFSNRNYLENMYIKSVLVSSKTSVLPAVYGGSDVQSTVSSNLEFDHIHSL